LVGAHYDPPIACGHRIDQERARRSERLFGVDDLAFRRGEGGAGLKRAFDRELRAREIFIGIGRQNSRCEQYAKRGHAYRCASHV